MPKRSWNIVDFSGGFNSFVDKRDIDPSESVVINELVSYNPGSLKLSGIFLPQSSEYGFLDSLSSNETLKYIQPVHGFRHFGRMKAFPSTNTDHVAANVLELANIFYNLISSDNGLSNGAQITIYQVVAEGGSTGLSAKILGNTYTIHDVTNTRAFITVPSHGVTNTDTAAGSVDQILFVVGTDVDTSFPVYHGTAGELTPYAMENRIDPNLNKYLLKSDGAGRVGYFELSTGAFIGNYHHSEDGFMSATNIQVQQPINGGGHLPYLFDMENLHDWVQNYYFSNSSRIKRFFYHENVIRVVPEIANCKKFRWNTVIRPVNYQYIPVHYKFHSSSDGRLYYSGWYPVRSHILSPLEYSRKPLDISSVGAHYDWTGGTSANSQNSDFGNTGGDPTKPSAGKMFRYSSSDGDIPTTDQLIAAINDGTNNSYPDYPYQFFITVAGSGSAGDGTWDFSSDGEYAKIKIGVSLLYDDIDQDPTSKTQESPVEWLEEALTMFPQGSGYKLSLAWMVKSGEVQSQQAGQDNLTGTNRLFCKNGGREITDGIGNYKSWNPRVMGANLYIMKKGPDLTELEDPEYLATINFRSEDGTYGNSFACDGTQSETWKKTTHSGNDMAYQGLLNIEAPPSTLDTFSTKNLNDRERWTPINVWYETSVMLNDRLYVGNVGYFDSVHPSEFSDSKDLQNWQMKRFPEKILVSMQNKFDTIPITNDTQVVPPVSSPIIHLEVWATLLFVYQESQLFIYDCSNIGEHPLSQSFYGQGIKHSSHVVKTSVGIFSINPNGIFLCDGTAMTNITAPKVAANYWRKNIYNDNSKIMFDPEYNNIMVTTTYNGKDTDSTDVDNLFIYNLANESCYLKSTTGASSATINGFSNPEIVDSRLYVVGYETEGRSDDSSNDSAVLDVTDSTAFNPGNKTRLEFSFSTAASGTWPGPGGGTCEANQLSTDVDFIKVQKDSDDKWYSLVPETTNFTTGLFAARKLTKGTPSASQLQKLNAEALVKAINELPNMNGYRTSAEIYQNVSDSYIIRMIVDAQDYGTAYNLLAEDISSSATNGSIYSSNTQVSFANVGDDYEADGDGALISSTVGTAGLNGGNINYFNVDTYTAATAPVAGVWKIEIDTNDVTQGGTDYIVKVEQRWTNNSIETNTFSYKSGQDYSDGGRLFTSLNDFDATENTRNDNVLTNLRNALHYGSLTSQEHSKTMQSTGFSMGDITGSTGSKYFNITMLSYLINKKIYGDALSHKITGFASNRTSTRTSGYGSQIYEWVNELPLDASNNSLIETGDILLETKDIDFGEPNVKKKVYAAYITYTLVTEGNGNIRCDYQANQSGTWTNADVFDSSGNAATNNYQLNTSATQTRAKLTFGTGGNNIYSFALRFFGIGKVSKFEINDISIIYRAKRPK